MTEHAWRRCGVCHSAYPYYKEHPREQCGDCYALLDYSNGPLAEIKDKKYWTLRVVLGEASRTRQRVEEIYQWVVGFIIAAWLIFGTFVLSKLWRWLAG